MSRRLFDSVSEKAAAAIPATLAVPAERDACRHDELFLRGRHRGEPLAVADRVGQLLAGPFPEPGLLVEQLQLRRAARLGEEDHPLGLGGEVGQAAEPADLVPLRLGRAGGPPALPPPLDELAQRDRFRCPAVSFSGPDQSGLDRPASSRRFCGGGRWRERLRALTLQRDQSPLERARLIARAHGDDQCDDGQHRKRQQRETDQQFEHGSPPVTAVRPFKAAGRQARKDRASRSRAVFMA